MPSLLINIDVPDLDRAIGFYRGGLGFTLERTLFERSVAEMTHDGVRIYLIEQAAGSQPVPGSDAKRAYEAHWTPVHLDLVVDDIETARARALDAGATASAPIRAHDWGDLAALRDPFGHGICLVRFSDRGYDLVAD